MTLKNIILLLSLVLMTWFLAVGLTKMKYGIKDSTPGYKEYRTKPKLPIEYHELNKGGEGEGYIKSFKGPDSCLYITVSHAGVIHSATCKNSNHATY